MNTQTQTTSMAEKQLFIKMVLSAWDTQNKRVDNLVDTLAEEQLLKETAPGRNTGIYLFGHLIAISDGILPLLGISEKLYPHLEKLFVSTPDKSGLQFPSVAELKRYWKEVNAALSHHFAIMQPGDWFARHNSVSEEDFAREPHRNKLNILINRTNHQSYHLGQLNYLK
jgi:DinB family protein